MTDISDELRGHIEAGIPASDGEQSFKLHPKGVPFDAIPHPGRYRTIGPHLAFSYVGKEDHREVNNAVTDALDHIDRRSKNPAHSYGVEEEDEDDGWQAKASPTRIQHRVSDEGYGFTTHHFRTADGKDWHLEHHTYNSGGNKALGLEGSFQHHVALYER